MPNLTQPVTRFTDAIARERWYRQNEQVLSRCARGDGIRRLFVDVSVIARNDAQTGIQRVVRAVWSELSRRSTHGFEVFPVHASTSRGYCYAPFDFLERSSHLSDTPVSIGAKDKFLGLDLAAHILPKHSRQLQHWSRCGVSIHLVIYDLLPLIRPDWFSDKMVANFSEWFDFLARRVDQAICISDQVARDVRRRLAGYATAKPAIAPMRLGADIAASVPSEGLSSIVSKLLARLRFRSAILMVGTIEPRKAYDLALDSFDCLWRSRDTDLPDLVIVGKRGWKTAELQARIRSHPEFGRRLHWFDQITDEELCLLYDACRGLFMTSRAEGFGLPLVEAATRRRYVLARDLPVFRERALPNLLYFNDDSPEALADELLKLLKVGQQSAPPAIDLPTWSECVDGLLDSIGLADFIAEGTGPLLRKRS